MIVIHALRLYTTLRCSFLNFRFFSVRGTCFSERRFIKVYRYAAYVFVVMECILDACVAVVAPGGKAAFVMAYARL